VYPTLPPPPAAGHLPQPAAGPLIVGKVGRELTTEQGTDAARVVILNILATLKGAHAREAGGTRQRDWHGCTGECSRSWSARQPHTSPLTHTPHARSRALAAEIGDLDKIKRFVKLTAFVNCVDSYTAQPKVANGASDVLGEIFGENGRHARSAVGVNALPLNVPVEIEAIVEVSE
jgi:hypothetical protein